LSGLNRQNAGLICGGVIYRKPFLVFLWTYDNPDVAGIETALTRRVFYNGVGHYQALVEVGLNPAGWKPAWEQPPPPIYFTETEKNTAPARPAAMPAFPSLADAAKVGNRRKATKLQNDHQQPLTPRLTWAPYNTPQFLVIKLLITFLSLSNII